MRYFQWFQFRFFIAIWLSSLLLVTNYIVLWKGIVQRNRFSAIFGDVAPFEALNTHKKSAGLGERVKTLCGILGYQKPHNAIRLQLSTFPSGRGMEEDE
jgi:hypothetical protein